MKALVMDIKGSEAVILDQEGIFRIVEDRDYVIGQEISIEESLVDSNIVTFKQKRRKNSRLRSVAAACMVLIFSGSLASIFIPSAQVQAKGKYALTYQINIWDRVIGIQGDNKAGQAIAKQIDLGFPGRPVDEVMEESMDIMEKEAGDEGLTDIDFQSDHVLPTQKERTQEHVDRFQKVWDKRKEERDQELVKKKKKQEKDSQEASPSGQKPGEPEVNQQKTPGKAGPDSGQEGKEAEEKQTIDKEKSSPGFRDRKENDFGQNQKEAVDKNRKNKDGSGNKGDQKKNPESKDDLQKDKNEINNNKKQQNKTNSNQEKNEKNNLQKEEPRQNNRQEKEAEPGQNPAPAERPEGGP